MYHPDAAAAPSLAVGHEAAGDLDRWRVHETASHQLAYYAGAPGDFANPVGIDARGFRPRVAADASGAVVEVHQGQAGVGGLWSRVGRIGIHGEHVAVAWTTSAQ